LGEDRYSRIESLLQEIDERLNAGERLLSNFSADVRDKWDSTTNTEPCGCVTTTKIYIGKDAPDLTKCRASAAQMKELFEQCWDLLRELRRLHMQREWGDKSPVLMYFLIACCTASDNIELLQLQYQGLQHRASELRNALTRDTAKTTRQASTCYCALHEPVTTGYGSD
jgi:hypothetical protein